MNKFIDYPVYPAMINQSFGENDVCINLLTKKVFKKIGQSCPVNCANFYKIQGMYGHNGVDFASYHGQPVYYGGPTGIVTSVSTDFARGIGCEIVSNDPQDFIEGVYHAKSRYWHMLRVVVKEGQYVKRGQYIGMADNSGSSSRNHNHYELKPVDKKSDGTWYNVFQDNGFYGAVDPEKYFTHKYAHKYSIIDKIIQATRCFTL